MITVNVKDVVGNTVSASDALILKGMVKSNLTDTVVLDFNGLENVPCTFFTNLLTDLISQEGRGYVSSHVVVKNLSCDDNYRRVVLGTSNIYQVT